MDRGGQALIVAEHDEAMTLQTRLLYHCEALAEAIAVPPSRRNGAAIQDGFWSPVLDAASFDGPHFA